MGAPDAKHAVLEELAGPVGVWEPGGTSPWGIQYRIVRGGNPEQADLSAVRFVKHRQSARRRRARGETPRMPPELEPFQEDTTHEHT